jgi:hypothetical protein
MRMSLHCDAARGLTYLGMLLTLNLVLVGTTLAQTPASSAPQRVDWYGDPKAPNISGVWVRVGTKEGWKPWPPPLKKTFAAIWKKRVADAAAGTRTDDPIRACLPPGMPRYMSGTLSPLLIIQTPGRVTLYRDGSPVRRIWTDGRENPQPADLEEFSNGNAIGRYEGSDLLTDVIGVKDQPVDSTGVPHTDQLRIVERFHRLDAQTLRVDLTLTDAVAFSKPITTSITYQASNNPLWEPREFICTPVTNYFPDVYVH